MVETILPAAATEGRVELTRRMAIAHWRWVFFALLLAWSAYVGKDVSWDVLNHQLYLPFSWITGRFRTDLFAASGQSYQNPLGYFPIYALMRLGVNSWGICFVLASLHAAVIWPLDRIARLFWPDEEGERYWMRVLSVGACCVAPVFLIHVGTTSSDPITALMVLWSLALSLESGRGASAATGSRLANALAGALLGLACAVKLSNLIFALALCLLWCGKRMIGQVRWTSLLTFGIGLACSFAIAAGPWMLWLWQDFGNPVFPLFNHLFHSPYAPQQALTTLRFVPATAWTQFIRLWELAQYKNFVSFEGFLPDVRPLLLGIAGTVVAVMLATRAGWRRVVSRRAWAAPGVQLALFVALSYVLWLRSSGNARYALPMFLVTGVALVRAVEIAFRPRITKIVMLAVLLLQFGNYVVLGTHRFTGTYWDGAPYLEYRMSERMRREPFLHLTLGLQTNSAAALFLAPDGAMANPVGGMPLTLNGPLGDRFRALLDKWHGRTRVLFSGKGDLQVEKAAGLQAGLRTLLYRVGLDVDWRDCERMALYVNKDDPYADKNGSLFSCAVTYRVDVDPSAEASRVLAERVFALFEKACPQDFSPVPFASDYNGDSWHRQYSNTDAALTASATQGVYFAHFRRLNKIHFGSIDDVLAQKALISCPLISFQTPE